MKHNKLAIILSSLLLINSSAYAMTQQPDIVAWRTAAVSEFVKDSMTHVTDQMLVGYGNTAKICQAETIPCDVVITLSSTTPTVMGNSTMTGKVNVVTMMNDTKLNNNLVMPNNIVTSYPLSGSILLSPTGSMTGQIRLADNDAAHAFDGFFTVDQMSINAGKSPSLNGGVLKLELRLR